MRESLASDCNSPCIISDNYISKRTVALKVENRIKIYKKPLPLLLMR